MLYSKVKEDKYVLSTLLENPSLAICIVVTVWIVAKAFKASMKVMKWVIICGLVYVGINMLSLI